MLILDPLKNLTPANKHHAVRETICSREYRHHCINDGVVHRSLLIVKDDTTMESIVTNNVHLLHYNSLYNNSVVARTDSPDQKAQCTLYTVTRECGAMAQSNSSNYSVNSAPSRPMLQQWDLANQDRG